MGTAESLANVKKIVENLEDEAVVVVSALGGLTDRLIATARMAADGNEEYRSEWDAMVKRHHDIIEAVVGDAARRAMTLEAVNPILDELRRLYDGVNLIADLPAKTLAQIVSTGERMSSVIVAAMLGGASHVNSLEVVKTEKWFDKNIAATEVTTRLLREALSAPGLTFPVVMGGFISSDVSTGEITNLGRGGSDYTAALVAAAMDADVLQIWTDVDGFLTSDPRIVKNARVIERMSFVESMDLCTFGAKVIYPPTIYPVFHKNIPIRILNTLHPEAPGTFISDSQGKGANGVAGLSVLRNEALVTLRGRMASNPADLSTRSLNALARKGLSVHLVAGTAGINAFSFALAAADIPSAVRLLKEEFAPELVDGQIEVIEVIENLATLAAVGDNIKKMPTIPGLILNILANEGIEVLAYSDKASETSLSYVIAEKDATPALKLLHRALFEMQ